MKRLTVTILALLLTTLGCAMVNAQSKEYMTIYNYANSNMVGKYRITTSQIPGMLIAQSAKSTQDRVLARKIDVIYQILVDGTSYYNGERATFNTDISNAIHAKWTLTEPHFSLADVYETQMSIKLNNATYIVMSRELEGDKREFVVHIYNDKSHRGNLTCIIGSLTLSDVTQMIVKE